MKMCPECDSPMNNGACTKCGYKEPAMGKKAPVAGPAKKAPPPMAGKRSLADFMRKK